MVTINNYLSKSQILFVDDEEHAVSALIKRLSSREKGFSFSYSTSTDNAREIVSSLKPEVAVVDLSIDPNIGPESGLQLITELIELDPSIRVIVLTGHDSEEFGIKALNHGAASFLTKPVETDHLLALIKDSVTFSQLKRKYREQTNSQLHLAATIGLPTQNFVMRKALEEAAFAASNSQPVLITGETGTGKGVLAQAIHKSSSRNFGHFVRFQPSFGSHDIISSELFGHTKGAFTGASESRKGLLEDADQGTLFIDEVDLLPVETQILLLDVLQEKVFRRIGSNKLNQSNFRLIAATNCPVNQLTDKAKLRSDFYHRIAHLRIDLPPLRQRLEDIPLLAEHFLQNLANREKISLYGLSSQTLSRLCRYDWPGNIRELQAVVEGAAYRACYAKRKLVEVTDLTFQSKNPRNNQTTNSFRDQVQNYELELVREALIKSNNNQTKAAQSLQLDRASFRRILKRSK